MKVRIPSSLTIMHLRQPKRMLVIAWAAMMFLFWPICTSKEVGPGSMAPDFMLVDLQGQRFYLNACQGHVVLVNFWSLQCVPCQKEMPELQKLWEDYRFRGVHVVGICVDGNQGSYVEKVVKDRGLSYPVLLDMDGTVAGRYGIKGIPVTFVIDPKGVVQERVLGYAEGTTRRYRNTIDRLLTEAGMS